MSFSVIRLGLLCAKYPTFKGGAKRMKIIFLVVGKTTESWVQHGIDQYVQRLKHYTDFSVEVIQDLKLGKKAEEELCRLEGELILKRVEPADLLVVLDENGRSYSSRELANQLQKWMNAAPKRILFVVGGAYGFSPSVLQRANAKLSLSSLTFTHQMVRPFFTEQLYRAFTILRGEKYHND
jgi:23S rRNA (pseudouridine1915-N3)-methyltransferase